jgi:hypothetical protein
MGCPIHRDWNVPTLDPRTDYLLVDGESVEKMKGNRGDRPYDIPEGIKSGDVFGSLVVVEFFGRNRRYQAIFSVNCECGSTTQVLGTNLKKGNTTHCNAGYHRSKHGMYGSPEYLAWQSMKARAISDRPRLARYYKSRGITICQEWIESFLLFYSHIGPMPTTGMQVDRINNDGNYEPGNVRWATPKEQMRNTRMTRMLTIEGLTKPQIQWAEESRLSISTLSYRVRRGWPESELLSHDKWRHRIGRCA